VRKVCVIMLLAMKGSGRADLTITITVRHTISEISHWKTFYISESFDHHVLKPLPEKETDWHDKF